MSSQALKTGLELTIQTPAFGYNQKQLTCYQTGSQEQKEQPISMIGHGHASWQGVYVLEPSFPHGAAKHKILMGHDHMAHIKKRMADDSLGDRKSCQEPGCNEVVDGRVVYCNNHSGGRSCQQLSHLQSARKSSDLCMSPVKGSQCNDPGSSTVTRTEQGVHIKYEGDDRCKLNDSSGNTQGDTGQFIFHGADMICKHENCSKQAQGNTLYCKLHSGGTKGCMVRAARKLHMEAHLYALAMEVGSGALFLDAQTQHVAKAAVTAALGMVVASDANLKGVGRVLKGTQTSASGMVGEGGANLKDVQRVHKDGQISALGMVGAVGASSKDATRAQNGGRISVLFIGRVC